MKNDRARIHIFVKDLEENFLPDASVLIKSKSGGEAKEVEYNKHFGKFILNELKPGEYKLEIRDKNGLESNPDVILKKGDNYIFSTLADSDTPYYKAAGGEKIYVRREEDRGLLFARGKDLQKKISLVIQKIKLEIGKDLIPLKENMQPDGGTFFIPFPDLPDKGKKIFKLLQKIIEKKFPEARLKGKLAVSMRRGKGNIEGLTNELTVRFKQETTEKEIKNIARNNGFQVVRKIPYLENAYLWRLNGLPSFGLLKTALNLDREKSIIFAEPRILYQIDSDTDVPVYEPNDFLYKQQTYLQKINAGKAWATLGNEGDPEITVAIIDLGAVDPRHPDLKGKIIANYDFVENTYLTEDNFKRELRKNSHGTQCASVAAGSSDNNLGAVGLAGKCSLIGARIGDSVGVDEIAKVWLWAAGLDTEEGIEPPAKGADVISNSWNWRTPNMRSLEDVAEKITREGRGGKGCVICFSISNDGYKNFETDHSYLCTDKFIKVGASINLNPTDSIPDCRDEIPKGQTVCEDSRALYSPFGHALDIVAPSSTAITLEKKDIDPILSAVVKNKGDLIGPEIVEGKNPTTLNKEIKGDSAKQIEVEVENTDAFKPGSSVMLGELDDEICEVKKVDSVKQDEAEKRKLLLISGIDNDYKTSTKLYGGDANYSKQFGGTSHACALIAGAAALLLSANPELNWHEVKEILCETAEQVDAGQMNETGRWEEIDGKIFSPWYGYGRLDIYAAVKMVKERLESTEIATKNSV